MTVCDPACGTGGFLLAAFDYMTPGKAIDKALQKKLRTETFAGYDIVDDVVRLAAMNLYLHGIGETESPIIEGDALATDPGKRCDMVLTNPPFGKKCAFAITGEDGKIDRESADSTSATTSSPDLEQAAQLSPAHHDHPRRRTAGRRWCCPTTCCSRRAPARRSAGGCSSGSTSTPCCGCRPASSTARASRRTCCSSTRSRRATSRGPSTLWIYDFRTNQRFTLKQNPLKREHLDDFVACFRAGERQKREQTERFRRFAYDELVKRDKLNLDIFWLKDDSLEDTANLPPPDVIAAEIVENLEAALEQFREVAHGFGLRGHRRS